MKNVILAITGLGLLAVGAIVEYEALLPPDTPRIISDTQIGASDSTPSAGTQEQFNIDVSGMLSVFESLPSDERQDQIADWAMYGTLLHANLSADDLRTATFNLTPVRLPYLHSGLGYDYGRGRIAYLNDGRVWFFYSAFDEHPKVTIARLSDRVLMETGSKPSLANCSFTSSVTSGGICRYS